MNRLIRQPLHPIIFAISPVLALLANNISQVKPEAALRPGLIAVGGALALWLAVSLLLRSWQRAALVSTWLLILFFTYGHVYWFLDADEGPAGLLAHHRYLLPLWLALAAAGSFFLLRRVKNLPGWNAALNWMGLVLLVIPLLQISAYAAGYSLAERRSRPLPGGFEMLQPPASEALPDVYYLILDAYTRQDVLSEFMHFDNLGFLQALTERGFYIAPCSQSNYAQTELALTSTMNASYLDTLGVVLKPGSEDRTMLHPLLHHSAVQLALERLGYTTVAFETGYLFTQLEDAAVYLSPKTGDEAGMSKFEVMLVRTTGGLALVDFYNFIPESLRMDAEAPKEAAYRRTRFTLDTLENLPKKIPGPMFVFAHIVAPHGPLVFDAQGELVIRPDEMPAEEYFEAYIAEVNYLNQRILAIVDAILANPERPAVIILQGDHGHGLSGPVERMAILNAFYLPGGSAGLYPSISPVNTFRVVLNRYFGGSFELLEDRSYFSYYHDPYTFEPIPNGCVP